MSLDVYRKISKYFHMAGDIHLQGWGEPLLYTHLFEMIKIAKAENCKVSLTTNGMLLTREVSERLITEGVDAIALSVAGTSKETHETIRRGSNFEQIVNNIRVLSAMKLEKRSEIPKLVLSFLMTKANIEELPVAVSLAKDMDIDELVAVNLDYTPTKTQDDLKTFSCDRVEIRFRKLIRTAEKRAKNIGLSFRSYPLETEEVIMCELNPLQIVFISYDGCVSPCVYLNMTKRGSIPRIFCGSHYEIGRLCFGSVAENDFMEVWNSDDYKRLRMAFSNRMKLLEKGRPIFDIKPVDFDLAGNPLPNVCKTCYKAYGI
jgi:MoaA/NifB/PqqE/SkfB family radical SAM enzyme